MQSDEPFRIVPVASGAYTIYSRDYDETFHPVIGPMAEAEALYVNQLRLPERLEKCRRPFVIWDVGLGAAANPLVILKHLQNLPAEIEILSFDQTTAPLKFALEHATLLGYLTSWQPQLEALLRENEVSFETGNLSVNWKLRLGDFPELASSVAAAQWPNPDVILFDAYSPATNPAMWTAPLFAQLFKLLAPERPCAMPTYSRSTMLRVGLLLAGFFVGVGHATGEKEETTIAANTLELIEEPLDERWLARTRNSTSAEPMWEPVYRQAPLSDASWEKLCAHPQFV